MSNEMGKLRGADNSLIHGGGGGRVPLHHQQEEREGDDALHLMDYWRTLIRQRWTIITVLVVITVIVTIRTYKIRPVYTATNTLRISREAPNVLSFDDVVKTGSYRDFYKTQYEIIKSRTLADKVIRKLNLDSHPEFAPTGKKNASLIGGISTTVRTWLSNAMSSKGKAPTAAEQSQARWAEDYKRSALISAFTGRIEVSPIRSSELVRVSANTHYPSLSKLIANTLAEEYIQQNLQSKAVTTIDASGQLSEQLVELKGRLEESEMVLYQYCADNGIVALDEKQDVLQDNLKKVSELLTETEVERMDIEALYNSLKDAELESIPSVIKSALVDDLEVEYVKTRSEYLYELGRLKPDHPAALRLQSQMETIKEMIDSKIHSFKAGLELEYKQSLAKEEELRNKLEELKKEMLVIAKKIVPYKGLAREVKANTELYNGLLQRMKEAGVSSEIKTTNVQIVDRAEIPRFPSKPNKRRNIMMALFVGLMCGTGLAFFIEYLDNTVKSPDDVEDRIKLPLLGFVPAIDERKTTREGEGRRSRTGGEDGSDGKFTTDLVTINDTRSSASEAYRTIRTAVLFSSPNRKVHSLLVTSAYPSEGKTVTAANLATVLAQGNDSVLIIDADLRRPRVHKVFKVDNARGLTNLLIGDAEMDDVIQKLPIENLSILPSGPIPPNPSELVGSKSMDEMIEKLLSKFDRIVFDSPPLVAVTDARIISTKVDGCICVIHAAKSDIRGTRRAKEQLEDIGGRFIGAVLNNVSMDRRTYYGYHYYRYGYYHKYYGEDKKS